ncbi:hypothetical protein [Prauserella endophytica]|uniref:SprT-like domain-containing protein n=1 Tax=Prauserella endophytica TaxID=1592324 RepID=A0ABY2RWK1_9PSEU|nr:hypothetical protein [Prauserella endophytica]TKG61542.1 hypothetical protein FCN18_33425 [Prauserella endophytica]
MTRPSAPQAPDVEQRLDAALEQMWRTIREHHSELPASPPLAERTHLESGGALLDPLTNRYPRRNELRDGAEQTLTALLHEAAHQLAETRGLTDTSNRGYYHNRVFADLADEVGLDVAKDDPAKPGGGPGGWSRITLPEACAARYAEQLTVLSDALADYPRPTPPPSRNNVVATCACPRRIRLAPSELAKGAIHCGLCDTDFTTG